MGKRVGANKRKNMVEKKKAVRKKVFFPAERFFLIVSIMIVVSGLCVGAVFGAGKIMKIAAGHKFLTVQSVEISGISRVDTATVVALSGLHESKSLIRLGKKSMQQKLEKLTWVNKVEISRRFPATVVIKVQEREPIALIASEGVYLTDESGILIELPKKEYFDLPVITGLKDSITPEGERKLVQEDLQRLTTFFQQIKKTRPETAKRLAQASFEEDGSIHLGFEASSTVIALELSRVNTGMSHLWQILQSLHAQEAREPKKIDLRYSNMAYVR